jgi:transcriptional regulator with PAS, ATPase and Fis domain
MSYVVKCRELINVLEQACLKKWEGEEIPMSSLPYELAGSPPLHNPSSLKTVVTSSEIYKKELAEKEIKLILQALERTKRNKRRAALLMASPLDFLAKDYRINI